MKIFQNVKLKVLKFILRIKVNEFNRRAYFWSNQNKAESDLLLVLIWSAPKITKYMRAAMEDLKLDDMIIVYPGNISHNLENKIRAITLKDALEYI